LNILRHLIISSCDLVSYLSLKIRKIAAPRKGDKLKHFDSPRKFWAYDLVISKQLYDVFIETGDTPRIEMGDVYTIGIVIGFYYPDAKYIKVAKLNTAELDKPVIEKHLADDLVVIDSPIQSLYIRQTIANVFGSSYTEPPTKTSDDGDDGDDGGNNWMH
jgi:hypothetical protein